MSDFSFFFLYCGLLLLFYLEARSKKKKKKLEADQTSSPLQHLHECEWLKRVWKEKERAVSRSARTLHYWNDYLSFGFKHSMRAYNDPNTPETHSHTLTASRYTWSRWAEHILYQLLVCSPFCFFFVFLPKCTLVLILMYKMFKQLWECV